MHIFQMQDLVKNRRQELYGEGDKVSVIEKKYGSGKKMDCFLHFNVVWTDEKGKQRVLGFGDPELFHLMKYADLEVHWDGTFKEAPAGFYQTLILSIIDGGSGMHVPIFYVLMSTKTESAYDIVFHQIKITIGKHIFIRLLDQLLLVCL